MTPEERITALKEAEVELRRIVAMIEKALHMSGSERRFGDIPEDILTILDSDDGLVNLIRELEYADEEHPPWTRPFASPKNVTRKDI